MKWLQENETNTSNRGTKDISQSVTKNEGTQTEEKPYIACGKVEMVTQTEAGDIKSMKSQSCQTYGPATD